MEYKDVLVETKGEIGLITMNSPKTFNALSKNMISEITAALNSFGADHTLKIIIIRTSGKHFCSGHNLTEMVDGNRSGYKFIFEQCSRMMTLVHEVPQLVIAQVHGVATAAGCQLAATCDLAVADETARFGTPGSENRPFLHDPHGSSFTSSPPEACYGDAHDRTAHFGGRGTKRRLSEQGSP